MARVKQLRAHLLSPTSQTRAVAIIAVALAWLLGPQVSAIMGPAVVHAQATYLSPPVTPLRVTVDPATLEPAPSPKTVPEGEPLPTEPAPLRVPAPDPVIQAQEALGLLEAIGSISSPVVNVPGMTSGANPPDVTGDVGPNHFVQMLNATQFRILNKQGVQVQGPSNFGNLWPAGDTCRSNAGDPIVVYDHIADRWLLSQFANPNHMCIAISQTPNPAAGTWFLYTINTGTFPDYPKFGVWPDGYYMSSYESPNLGVYVFDRTNMLLGNAAGFMKTTISSLGAPGVRDTRILPADLDGPSPPSGTPGIFVRTVDGQQDPGNPNDRIEIYTAQVDWNNSTFTFSLANTLTPAAFDIMTCNRNGGGVRDCIPQNNDAATVDALSNRPMMQLKYRTFGSDQRLVVNQTIDVAGSIPNTLGITPANEVAGIRWYELQNTGGGWSIRQEGTYAPQPLNATAENQLLHRWMGSAAIDKDGNIALGYSITNDDPVNSVMPGIRYTGRRFDDPLGLMPQGEQVILNGPSWALGGFGLRWGDYSQMGVDPVDDCTIWYNQHDANGATQIASFRFNTCGTDLAIAKTAAPSPAAAGAQLIYTVTVTNNGPINATNVTVVDTLPVGVTYVSSTDTCVEAPAGTLTCNLGSIANGASTSFEIKVQVSPAAPATLTNTAVVSADQADLDGSNDKVDVTTLVNQTADLQLTKVCKPDGPAPAGSTATCTILVDNLGPSDAQGVVVTDTHLSNGPFTITSATASPGGACPIAGGVVTCNLGTEPAGGRTTITVQITSTSQVDVNDTATVTSTTPDPNPSNNVARASVSFRGTADVSIIKSAAPSPVVAGTSLTYTLTVFNNGPSTAPNVVVKDTMPGQVSDVSFTPSQGSCTGGIPGNPAQPFTCTLGSLANAASATITFVAKVNPSTPDGTVLVNNATVASDYADPNNGNNSATALTTAVARADLAVTKTSDKPTYKPSSVITYTVTVTNGGASDAQAVVVTDNLPDIKAAIYQSDTGGCTKSGATLTCNIGTLAVGGSKSFNIYLLVKGNRGTVTNTATVQSSTTDPVAGNNTVSYSVTIQGGG